MDEDELTDAPKSKTNIRLKSPEGKKAIKRGTASHDEGPSAKRISFEDVAMEGHYGIDVGSLALERKTSLYLTTPS